MHRTRTLSHSQTKDVLALLVLLLTFIFGAIAVIWFCEVIAPSEASDSRRDPRVPVVGALVVFLGLPAIRFRRKYVELGLAGWPRVSFCAIATTALLAASWAIALYVGFGFPGSDFLHAIHRFADLDQLQSKWNAGLTLVLGVWFWIVSFIVASAGGSPSAL